MKIYEETIETQRRGIVRWFFLSYFIPFLGGMITFLVNRNNKELAKLCFVLSFFHPMIILTISYFVDLYLFKSFFFYGSIIFLLLNLFLTITFLVIFNENSYKSFIPVWYFGIFGLLYKYNEFLKERFIFVILQFFISFIFSSIIIGVIKAYAEHLWLREFVESLTKEWEEKLGERPPFEISPR